MPGAKSYKGQRVKTAVVGEFGPRRGRRPTHNCWCEACKTTFLATAVRIQKAMKANRSICPTCRQPRNSRKSYIGTKIGCSAAIEFGPDQGRRTTHICLCAVTDQLFCVTSVTIQQAVKNRRSICPYCARQRTTKKTKVNDIIQGLSVLRRLPNGTYPGGRTYVRWWVACYCTERVEFAVDEKELQRIRGGKRLTKLNCGCEDSDDLSGRTFGRFWYVMGPAPKPASKEKKQERFWNARCVAPKGAEVCGTLRVKSTSDLRKQTASDHCGCLSSQAATEYHAVRRKSDLDIGIYKLLKDYRNKPVPDGFMLDEETAKELLLSNCTYCGSGVWQLTQVEIYSTRCRKIPLSPIRHGGIDRVDSTRGYLRENCVPACKCCNWFKQNQTVQELADRLARIQYRSASILDAVNSRNLKTPAVTEWLLKNRNDFCRITYNYILRNLRSSKRSVGWPYALTDLQFELLSHAECFYCGIPPSSEFRSHVRFGPKKHCCNKCPGCFYYHGLDRVDSSRGYEVGNVVPCCRLCNTAKMDMSVTDFLRHSELMFANLSFWAERIKSWSGVTHSC
jgi:hypothetical protein